MSGCVQHSRMRCSGLYCFHEEVQPTGCVHVLMGLKKVTCLSCESHMTHLKCGRSVQQLEQTLCLVPPSLLIGAEGMGRRGRREEEEGGEERGRRVGRRVGRRGRRRGRREEEEEEEEEERREGGEERGRRGEREERGRREQEKEEEEGGRRVGRRDNRGR